MKYLTFLVLLALMPTNLLSSSAKSSNNIHGLWVDHYSDTKLQIKHHRKGIKVRRIIYGKKKKWRTYYRMGRGVYDDCKGKAIIAMGRNRIEWRKGRRNYAVLSRYDDYGYRNDYGNRYDYDYYDRRGYRGYNGGISRFFGDWYCADYGLELNIQSYRDGFRARRPGGDWTYYNRYNDREYRDRRGNSYYFDGDRLIWESRDRRRKFKFSKR